MLFIKIFKTLIRALYLKHKVKKMRNCKNERAEANTNKLKRERERGEEEAMSKKRHPWLLLDWVPRHLCLFDLQL